LHDHIAQVDKDVHAANILSRGYTIISPPSNASNQAKRSRSSIPRPSSATKHFAADFTYPTAATERVLMSRSAILGALSTHAIDALMTRESTYRSLSLFDFQQRCIAISSSLFNIAVQLHHCRACVMISGSVVMIDVDELVEAFSDVCSSSSSSSPPSSSSSSSPSSSSSSSSPSSTSPLTRKQRIHQLLTEQGITGDELDRMFSAIHHGATEPVASRVYHKPSASTVNRVRDRKILISDGMCDAQLIHLDNTAPLMVTAVYLHEVDEMVPATEFFDSTDHKTGQFEVREVDVEMKEFTRRYRPPWSQHECYNHTRNESMVPVMSIGMFVSTLLHRGPNVTSNTGLRIVLFQTCAEPTYTITREALLYQTFEFKFVLDRCMARFDQLKDETQQRYRRIMYRVFTSDEYRLRWRQHIRGDEQVVVNELLMAATGEEHANRQRHDSSIAMKHYQVTKTIAIWLTSMMMMMIMLW
jgi:hypothetical protein